MKPPTYIILFCCDVYVKKIVSNSYPLMADNQFMSDSVLKVRNHELPVGSHQVDAEGIGGVTLTTTPDVCTGEPVCTVAFQAGGQDVRMMDRGCDGVEIVQGRDSQGRWQTMVGSQTPAVVATLRDRNRIMEEAIQRIASDFSLGDDNHRGSRRIELAADDEDDIRFRPFGGSRLGSPIQDEVFFATDQAVLNDGARVKLDNFVQQYARQYLEDSSPPSIIVEGHCDHRGTVAKNLELGRKRALAIKEYLAAAFVAADLEATPAIHTYSLGEAQSTDNLDKSRRGVVLSGTGVVTRALGMIPARSVYLIDSSGSMKESSHEGYVPWGDVASYSFPEESVVCNFDGDGMQRGIGSPGGGTPLWESAYTTLQRMQPKQSLLILSDGENTGKFTHGPKEIIRLAQQKRIPVSIIFIGKPNPKITEPLASIAVKTGGTFYLPSQ